MRTKTVVRVAVVLVAAGTAAAQKFEVPSDLLQVLSEEVAKPVVIYALDEQAARQVDEAFETWVGRRIDVKTARRIESTRFPGRVTYALPRTDAAQGAVQPAETLSQPQQEEQPSVFYVRDRNHFTYRKIREAQGRQTVDKGELAQTAKAFLVNGGFVLPAEFDGFGDSVVRTLRNDTAVEGQAQGEDQVLLQSVKFSRRLLAAPVFNSAITVDYDPESMEVIGFKHHSWTPIIAQGMMMQPAVAGPTLQEIVSELQEEAREYVGERGSATLRQVVRGWFQTDIEMVPVLICRVETPHGDHLDGYTQIVGLVPQEASAGPGKQPPGRGYADWRRRWERRY
jgi:hypothetical protein